MDGPSIDNPDLTLSELFAAWPETIQVFISHRTHCVGCCIAPFHTIIDACTEYDLPVSAFRADLLAAVSKPADENR